MTEDRIPRCPDCGRFYSRHDADDACGGRYRQPEPLEPAKPVPTGADRLEALTVAYGALTEHLPQLRLSDLRVRLLTADGVAYCSTNNGRRQHWRVDLGSRRAVEVQR